MTVYVDALEEWGWKLRGRTVASCHIFTDALDLAELHQMAVRIGMKLEWFQQSRNAPHYDLTKSRRDLAVHFGAVEVGRRDGSRIRRERRELAASSAKTMDIVPSVATENTERHGHATGGLEPAPMQAYSRVHTPPANP
jgi:hypothetical protein